MGAAAVSAAPSSPKLALRARLHLGLSAFRLAWSSSKSETVLVLTLQILVGLSFPLQLLAGKWALDEVVEAAHPAGAARTVSPLPGPHAHENVEAAFLAAAVAVAAVVAGRLIGAVSRQRQRLFPQLVRKTVNRLIGEQANTLDLQTLETPTFADTFTRVQREAAYRPANMVYDMMTLVASSASILMLVVLLLATQPLVALTVPLAFVPPLLASVEAGRASYQHMVRNTSKERLMWYLGTVMTQPSPAKETRAFGLGGYLLSRQQRLFDELIADLRQVIRGSIRRDVIASLGSAAVTGGAMLFIVWLYFQGQLSVGDTVASAGAVLMVSVRMNAAVTSAGLFYENVLFLKDLTALLDLPARQSAPADHAKVQPLMDCSVDAVTFSYPEADKPALQGVSLELRAGETVALVGENGAGKTTLAKLILRLYDPGAGVIRWNGTDIRSYDPEEYRRRVVALFQDFTRYEMSARENVGFGDITSFEDLDREDLDRVTAAARRADAHDFLSELPDGYGTVLGRLFDQGRELSLGQWQRVALSRAFFRDANLVVMDEPTASLDAHAEARLFVTMKELFANRAVLLISHRFSSVRMADRIYVLRDGQIAEQGTHEELMAARGLYAELFTTQASAYATKNTLDG